MGGCVGGVWGGTGGVTGVSGGFCFFVVVFLRETVVSRHLFGFFFTPFVIPGLSRR